MTTQPQNLPAGNDALMGGSSFPTLKIGKKYVPAGVFCGGRIVAGPDSYQVRETTRDGSIGNPKYYPSGDPIIGVHVDVQTNERDPQIEGDNGVRRVYIEGSLKDENYRSRRKAVVDAVRQTGAKGLEIGGELQLAWTREVDTGAPTPAQDWVAQYVRPANMHLGANQPQQQPAQAQYQQPMQQQAQPQYGGQAGYGQQAQYQQAAQTTQPQYQQPAPQPVQQQPAAASAQQTLTPEQMEAMRNAGVPEHLIPGYQQAS